MKKEIFTVGHSTRTIEELAELLRAYEIERLVDVRTIPRSRTNPQFNRETLSKSLSNRKIRYRHLTKLGGLRHAQKDSLNAGWRNASFRGYADYMQLSDFNEGLEKLIELSQIKRTAIMCAEAVPWRCHRSLIADALTVRGFKVTDIISVGSARKHTLNRMAVVRGKNITYPIEV